ncbi:MAG TPA: carboxyl transferase domain-containing protein [Mycobacteriales bacterium]
MSVLTIPAQERIDVPVDPRDPWVRLRLLADGGMIDTLAGGGGVVAAVVRLRGVRTVAFATDVREQGGAVGAHGAETIVGAYETAVAQGLPIVGIWHSGGARLREGVASLHGIGRMFAAMTHASGVVPQVSLVLGPAAGGAAYGPALTDVVVMAPEARVFVTGPDIIRSVTFEEITAEELGGPDTHAKSGVTHLTAPTAEAAYDQVRDVIALLASQQRPTVTTERPDPGDHLPVARRRAYDVKPVMAAVLDGAYVELQAGHARNIVTALGRIEGRTVGVVATNPLRQGGCLTAATSDKAARFVRLCDAFGIPLVFLVDVPGYLPGSSQEREAIVRRGAKLVHAVAAAKVPRITVILRKAYGGAFIALNSKSLGATEVLAWRGAEVDVMSAEAAVKLLHRKALAADPDRLAELTAQHLLETGGLDRAIADGVIDAVIDPAETRSRIARTLSGATPARNAISNIPL